jgi:hypothetical protein
MPVASSVSAIWRVDSSASAVKIGLGAGHGLDKAQQDFGGGGIGQTLLAIGRPHFQLVTICHQLTAFLAQPFFQLVPVFPCRLVIGLLGQRLNDVDHREPPGFGSFVIDAADSLGLEKGGLNGHGRIPSLIQRRELLPVEGFGMLGHGQKSALAGRRCGLGEIIGAFRFLGLSFNHQNPIKKLSPSFESVMH